MFNRVVATSKLSLMASDCLPATRARKAKARAGRFDRIRRSTSRTSAWCMTATKDGTTWEDALMSDVAKPQTRSAAVICRSGRPVVGRIFSVRRRHGFDRARITPKLNSEAWLSPAWRIWRPSPNGWAEHLTLIATLQGSPVGFACSLRRPKTRSTFSMRIRSQAGRASATYWPTRWETRAGARGAAKLIVDASDTARGFFEKRGYVAQQRNSILGRRRMAGQHDHAQATCNEAGGVTTKPPETPFPRHWKYYIVLKYAVMAAAVLLALYVVMRLA